MVQTSHSGGVQDTMKIVTVLVKSPSQVITRFSCYQLGWVFNMCQCLLTIIVRKTRQRGKWHPQPCEERFEVRRRRRRAAPIFFGLEETCNLGGQTLTSVHSDVEKEADLDVQSRLLPM